LNRPLKHLQGECQVCGRELQFPAEAVGTTGSCPYCGKETELLLAQPPAERLIPRSTIFWTAFTVLLLLVALGAAVFAVKRAQQKAAQSIRHQQGR
jgi:hypothetical protein